MNRNALRLLLLPGAVLTLLVQAAPASAASVPVSDPKAIGVIGLCDQSLHPISHGNLADTPFVWRAVGATAAKGAWAKPGGTATLYAYQPRPSVPAAEWSGIQLTASGHYSNAAHPMAQATHADTSLAEFVAEFPPEVDGLIELRLYLGGPQLPIYMAGYDVTFVKVTGSTWSVVQGGSVSCGASTSVVSPETVLLPSSVVNPKPTASASGASDSNGTSAFAAGSSGGSSSAPSLGSSGSPTPGSASPAAADLSPSKSSSSSAGWVVLGVLCLLLLGLGAGFAYRRRRAS